MNNNEELLRQCIASGQVSASQIEAHRQAGDLSDERSSGATAQSPAVVKLEPLAVAYGEIPTDDNWISVPEALRLEPVGAGVAQELSVASAAKFKVGDLVTKIKGSQWKGRVVGTYSTTLTPEGYAVESSTECGSVQIYPAAALELVEGAQEPGEIDRLRAALVYTAFALHDKPQYMLADGIALIDGDTVQVSRDGWTVQASINPLRQSAQPAPQPAPHLPERDASLPAERQGLFRKFVVGRVDGSDKPGGKHHGCTYFVLDVDHDPCARPALVAYAAACESTHPTLAADLRTKWGEVPAPQPAPAPLSEREAFEVAWEKMHGKRPVLWSQMFTSHKMETPAHSQGKYFAASAQAAWKLWQARAALAAQGGAV